MEILAKDETPAGISTGVVFKNLGRKKVYEEVADHIREQILTGRLRLSDRLPTERDLAEQLGVGRGVVREAIRMLELSGLLTVKKGMKGGIFVTQDYERPINDSITNLLAGGEATLENLFEVRELLEPYAAARAALLGTEDEFKELTDLIWRAGRAKGNDARLLNLEFHGRILRMGRNPVLSIVGESVLGILNDRIKSFLSPDTSEMAQDAHKKVLKAIVARQAAEAEKAMREDIRTIGVRFAEMAAARSTQERAEKNPGPPNP